MEQGTSKLQTRLARLHAWLSATNCRRLLPRRAAGSPGRGGVRHVLAVPGAARWTARRKSNDPAAAKREAVIALLGGGRSSYYWGGQATASRRSIRAGWTSPCRPKHLDLVRQLIRPGHAGANAFLKETFDAALKKAKSLTTATIVSAMIFAQHPDATDAFIAAFTRQKQHDYRAYWFARLIPDLPKSAVPKLEGMVPELDERQADTVVDYIQQLRDKK